MWQQTVCNAMLYVDKVGSCPCWIWQGASAPNGYGKITSNYKTLSAHRYMYENLVGAVPIGMQLDHLCGNKLCVNPQHLEVVTCGENIQRYNSKITHCKRGH